MCVHVCERVERGGERGEREGRSKRSRSSRYEPASKSKRARKGHPSPRDEREKPGVQLLSSPPKLKRALQRAVFYFLFFLTFLIFFARHRSNGRGRRQAELLVTPGVQVDYWGCSLRVS